MKKVIFAAVMLSATFLFPADEPGYDFKNWGIPRETALSSHGLTPARNLTAAELMTLKNQIYRHIIAINPEIQDKVTVVRTGEKIRRDLILVKEMLFCVTDEYQGLTPEQQKNLFLKIQQIYGMSTVKKEGDISIYSISTEKTDVLINIRPNGEFYDMKIYLYPKNLISMLLMAGP